MLKKVFIIITLLLAVGLIAVAAYAYFQLQPVSDGGFDEEKTITFKVSEGESLYSVLGRLEKEALIGDSRVYKVYGRFVRSISVKKGVYTLNPGMSGLEILSKLEEGRQELIRITIPEGLSSRQIASLLEEEGILKAEDFLKALTDRELLARLGLPGDSAEGFLFPDTYRFQKDFPAEQVLSHMVDTYFETLDDIFPFYKDLSDEKLLEKAILASIVEKEYRVAEEAPLIASVFNNRLKVGMPMQSCATVIYVITEELGRPHPDRVYFRDLELESPYNTYINDNLPPRPISNPGKTALAAAFNPSQTDFLFFVVKDAAAGTHFFSSSLADHNSARADYIQGFRSK